MKKSEHYDDSLNDMIDLHKRINEILGIEIDSPNRKNNYIAGRSIFSKIAYFQLNLTYQDISIYFKNCLNDHVVVRHAILKSFDELVMQSVIYKGYYDLLSSEFYHYRLWSKIKLEKEINRIRKERIVLARKSDKLMKILTRKNKWNN